MAKREEVNNEEQSRVVMVQITDLKLMEENPRIITDDNFRKLQQSINMDPNFMYNRPILVNKVGEDMYIYAGSQRYKACLDLEYEEVPCIVEEDLPKEVVDRRMLVDNTHQGKWDDAMLTDFNTDSLKALDLTAMKTPRLDFSDFNAEDILKSLAQNVNQGDVNTENFKAPDKGPAEQDTTENYGGHNFNLMFSDKEEHDQFFTLFNNLPKKEGERPEDALIRLFGETYPEELR